MALLLALVEHVPETKLRVPGLKITHTVSNTPMGSFGQLYRDFQQGLLILCRRHFPSAEDTAVGRPVVGPPIPPPPYIGIIICITWTLGSSSGW